MVNQAEIDEFSEIDELNESVTRAMGELWSPANDMGEAWALLVEAQLGIEWDKDGRGWVHRWADAIELVEYAFASPAEIPAAICRAWLAWKEAQG